MAAACSCVFNAFYIGLLIGIFYPVITAALSRSPDEVAEGPWLPNSFQLITASFAGLIGSMSDVYV